MISCIWISSEKLLRIFASLNLSPQFQHFNKTISDEAMVTLIPITNSTIYSTNLNTTHANSWPIIMATISSVWLINENYIDHGRVD